MSDFLIYSLAKAMRQGIQSTFVFQYKLQYLYYGRDKILTPNCKNDKTLVFYKILINKTILVSFQN